MSHTNRLGRLENNIRKLCPCGKPEKATVVDQPWFDGSPTTDQELPEPEKCPRCGKPDVVHVRIEEDPAWYGNDAHKRAGEAGPSS